MAYTTETTIVTGTTILSTWANTYVRDNVEWLATNAPCCRAYNNANISHSSSGSYQAVTFNSNRFDNAGMHSTISNTSRFTVPASSAGKYLVGSCIEFAGNATGGRAAAIKLNGATYLAQDLIPTAAAGLGTGTCVTTTYSLAVSDYVEVYGFQNSGGALNMNSNPNISPEAWALWLRN